MPKLTALVLTRHQFAVAFQSCQLKGHGRGQVPSALSTRRRPDPLQHPTASEEYLGLRCRRIFLATCLPALRSACLQTIVRCSRRGCGPIGRLGGTGSGTITPMPTPPESTKSSLQLRLITHTRDRWPQISKVDTRFRSNFAYIAITAEDNSL